MKRTNTWTLRWRILTVVLCATTYSNLAADRQSLPNQVPSAVKQLSLQPIGRMPADQRLHLILDLPLHNSAQLEKLVADLYDDDSPLYQHYLTPSQFRERFAPTQNEYEAVLSFARSNGWVLSTPDSGRLLVKASATAAEVERACHVRMLVYQHPTEKRTFYAPDSDPSLDLSVPLLAIEGLDNFNESRPAGLNIQTNASYGAGSGPGGTLMGYDFRNAYVPDVLLDGAGQAVGLLEEDTFFYSDITNYETQAGLPLVPLVVESVDDFDTNAPPGRYNDEVSLDIEMVAAMAPGLSSLMIYEGSTSSQNSILEQMAEDHEAMQLSSSFLFSANQMTSQLLQKLAAQNQSFFQASGDDCAYPHGIFFEPHAGPPADNPFLTSVGGTLLTMENGQRQSEFVWNNNSSGTGTNGSGGGISTNYAIPPWQRNTKMSANHGSETWRNIPDVAMAADNIKVFYSNSTSFGPLWGTSCAAPLWAGFTALVNEQRNALGMKPVGFLNPLIYKIGNSVGYNSAFHDISVGNNTNAHSPRLFQATQGYDLCTGWGTPDGMNLINALVTADPLVISPSPGIVAYGSSGQAVTPGSEVIYLTNSGKSTLAWSAASDSLWLTVAPNNGSLQKGDKTALQVTYTGSATNLVEGFHLAGIVISNLMAGTSQLRQFPVEIGQPPITFDDLIGTNGSLIRAGYHGLYWSNFGFLNAILYTNNPSGYPVGMVSAPNVAYNQKSESAWLGGPAPFNLISAFLTSAWRDNLEFEAIGYIGTKVLYDQNYTLSATNPVNIVFNYIGVTSVEFISTNGVHHSGYTANGWEFVMDNVMIEAPAPTLSLAGKIGLNTEVEGTSAPYATVDVFEGDSTNGTLLGVFEADSSGRYEGLIPVTNSTPTLTAVAAVGDLMSSQSLSVIVAPVVTITPLEQTNFVGSAITFSAKSVGASPLRYTWAKDGIKIRGAIGSKLAISRLTTNSSGTYSVTVSNPYGSNTAFAVLKVEPNPLATLDGTYYGLFQDTNAQVESTGSIRLSLDPQGSYSLRMFNAGHAFSASGAFSQAGTATWTINRDDGRPPLALALSLDLTNETDQIRGVVTSSEWTSYLLADRAVFNATASSPNRGRYVMVLENQNKDNARGMRDGFCSMAIDAFGMVAFSGKLPDSTFISAGGVPISKYGTFPIYIPLEADFGAVSGWINFTNTTTASFVGNAWWIGRGPKEALHPLDFTNMLRIIGSAFVPVSNASTGVSPPRTPASN